VGGVGGFGGCTEGAAGCTECGADLVVVVVVDEVLYFGTLGVTDDVTMGDTGYL